MKHFWKRALTLLLTAGMLFSATMLPSMAEEAPAGETQTGENPYILPEDSPYLFMIELLDENDQPLEGQTLYYEAAILEYDPNSIYCPDLTVVGINKVKIRLSIRKDVEVYMESEKTLKDPSLLFEGYDPWTAGEISEVYTLSEGRDNYFDILFKKNGVSGKAELSISYYNVGEFTIIPFFLGKKGEVYSLGEDNYQKYVINQDTKDDPVVWYCTADELAEKFKKIQFDGLSFYLKSINGLEGISGSYDYILTGAENYITLEYFVPGISEPRTTRLILREEGKELWSNPFEDVRETDTFYNALSYCHRNGLLKGTGETKFSPDEETNRAMIVTTLYRIAGSPAVSGTNPFTDVPAEQWYTDAVIWASEKGIVNGYDKEHFGPMDTITREQFAAILYRYAQMLYPDMKLEDVSMHRDMYENCYDFVMEVSEYAKDALAAAADNYILGFSHDENGHEIRPKDAVTRADLACGLFGLNRSLLVKAAASAQ